MCRMTQMPAPRQPRRPRDQPHRAFALRGLTVQAKNKIKTYILSVSQVIVKILKENFNSWEAQQSWAP